MKSSNRFVFLIEAQGGGDGSPESRVIADIARERNGKGKTYRGSTRMNADQEIGLGMGWDEVE
jgi:hypothetical protein